MNMPTQKAKLNFAKDKSRQSNLEGFSKKRSDSDLKFISSKLFSPFFSFFIYKIYHFMLLYFFIRKVHLKKLRA